MVECGATALLGDVAMIPLDQIQLMARFPANFPALLEAIGQKLAKQKQRRSLTALVLAHPADDFVTDQVLPRLRFWHLRSGDAVDFVFFGYSTPPFKDGQDGMLIPQLAEFDDRMFIQAIEHLEATTTVTYSGRTMLLLTVAEMVGEVTLFNFDWVVDFDIEGLIKDGAIADVRTLFEDIIRLAKHHPADDSIWMISESLSDDGKSDAFMSLAEQYVPFLKNAREVAKAHTRFRVRSRNQE